jgi:hypothetical protein
MTLFFIHKKKINLKPNPSVPTPPPSVFVYAAVLGARLAGDVGKFMLKFTILFLAAVLGARLA